MDFETDGSGNNNMSMCIGAGNTIHVNTGYTIGSLNELSTYANSAIVLGHSCTSTINYGNTFGLHVNAEYECQLAIGKYNAKNPGYLTIGRGIYESSRANCFRVTAFDGVYASGNYNSSGADYAEYFEWEDDNPDNEDRVGLFVTLDGEYIKIATSTDDYILGAVSGNPSIVGDSYDDQWQGMFERDIYGRPIIGDVRLPEERDEKGNVIVESRIVQDQLINPNYNNAQEYIGRSKRPEWDCVGLLGKLIMRDDGTSKVNGYIKSNDYGEATYSDKPTKFRVLSRLDENHIKILIIM